jgi:hypothetical protein
LESRTTEKFRRLLDAAPPTVQAVGVLRDETIVWFCIGSHGDYEKLLSGI